MKYLGFGMCFTAGFIVGLDVLNLLAVMIGCIGSILVAMGGKP